MKKQSNCNDDSYWSKRDRHKGDSKDNKELTGFSVLSENEIFARQCSSGTDLGAFLSIVGHVEWDSAWYSVVFLILRDKKFIKRWCKELIK